MSMHVIIRAATEDDALEIQKVIRNAWLDAYPNDALGIARTDIPEEYRVSQAATASLRKRLLTTSPEDGRFWVATDDEKVLVGMIEVHRSGAMSLQATITHLFVAPRTQRQHIGSELLDTALNWLGKAIDVRLTVPAHLYAKHFYAKHGFHETNEDAPFYETGGEVAIAMVRMLRRGRRS